MSNLQNLCRNCGRDLGRDQQSLALGACSGRCAKALAPKVVSCGVFFLNGDARAVCCLSPGHIGSHKDVHGFMWTEPSRVDGRADLAAWNEFTIRQQGKVRNFPNGPVDSMAPSATKGEYLTYDEISNMANGGNTRTALSRAACACHDVAYGDESLSRAVPSR